MNNIAEGFERGSNAEFIRFLYISKASVGEAISMTYIAKDLDYITQKLKPTFTIGQENYQEASRI